MTRCSTPDPLEKYFGPLFVAIIGGVLIWDLLPHWASYALGGTLVAATVVGIVLRIQRGRWPGSRNPMPPPNTIRSYTRPSPLSGDDRARLINAAGVRCENPKCANRDTFALCIHHIIPQNDPHSTNKLANLIVLCAVCHRLADQGTIPRSLLQLWARPDGRFQTPTDIRHWDAKHG